MDLKQLEAFSCVYEEQSFSRAAERLGLTQPTISGHIKALETNFDIKLLDRLGRKTVPTKAGEYLYRHGRSILDMRRSLNEGMQRFLGRVEGELSLAASTIPGEYLLPGFIGRFHQTYPKIRIGLQIQDTRAVIEGMGKGAWEAGFTGARSNHPELEFERFAFDRLVVAIPASMPWQDGETVSLEDLRHEPLVMREPGSGTRTTIEQRLTEVGRPLEGFNIVAELGSTAAVKEAIKGGVGWSILSELAIGTERHAHVLKKIQLAGTRVWNRSFYIVVNRRRVRSPICQTFVEELRAQTVTQPAVSSRPAALDTPSIQPV